MLAIWIYIMVTGFALLIGFFQLRDNNWEPWLVKATHGIFLLASIPAYAMTGFIIGAVGWNSITFLLLSWNLFNTALGFSEISRFGMLVSTWKQSLFGAAVFLFFAVSLLRLAS